MAVFVFSVFSGCFCIFSFLVIENRYIFSGWSTTLSGYLEFAGWKPAGRCLRHSKINYIAASLTGLCREETHHFRWNKDESYFGDSKWPCINCGKDSVPIFEKHMTKLTLFDVLDINWISAQFLPFVNHVVNRIAHCFNYLPDPARLLEPVRAGGSEFCRAADIWIVAPSDVRILLHFCIQDIGTQPLFVVEIFFKLVKRLFNVIVNESAVVPVKVLLFGYKSADQARIAWVHGVQINIPVPRALAVPADGVEIPRPFGHLGMGTISGIRNRYFVIKMIFFVGLGDFINELVEHGSLFGVVVLVAGTNIHLAPLCDPEGSVGELDDFPDFAVVADKIHFNGLQDPGWVGNSGCHC